MKGGGQPLLARPEEYRAAQGSIRQALLKACPCLPIRRQFRNSPRWLSLVARNGQNEGHFMPWSNQTGGPWGGGGDKGGPWGQGPSGQRGGSGGPPDLEEIIRRGQDRLRQALPGGGA